MTKIQKLIVNQKERYIKIVKNKGVEGAAGIFYPFRPPNNIDPS